MEVRKLARELLCSWGSCSTADDFVEQMFSPSLISQEDGGSIKSSLAAYGIVSEFQKHVALIGDFAQKLTDSFNSYDTAKFSQLNTKLADILSQCGSGVSTISTLKSWLELMSVTGILHGCTLSMSRLVCCAEFLKRINPTSDVYTHDDDNSLLLGMATIIGVIEGRHVFTDKVSPAKMDYCLQVSPAFDPISSNVCSTATSTATATTTTTTTITTTTTTITSYYCYHHYYYCHYYYHYYYNYNYYPYHYHYHHHYNYTTTITTT
jgi:hypothetical protein